MSVNSDFKEILSIFNDKRVKYLVVGGHAVIKYTEPRYTKDLDIWVKADAENAQAVFAGLKELPVGPGCQWLGYSRRRRAARKTVLLLDAG